MNTRKRQPRIDIRFGFGYDIHRFAAGRKLILGGVHIPCPNGLLGHSDADVLLHAICDALLGAAALGDIGRHFPDTDKRFEGIASTKLLKKVGTLLRKQKFSILNIDSTVVLESPKIALYVPHIKKNIALVLGVEPDRVSVKATTNEGLGSLGAAEGCAAYAVTSISAKSES